MGWKDIIETGDRRQIGKGFSLTRIKSYSRVLTPLLYFDMPGPWVAGVKVAVVTAIGYHGSSEVTEHGDGNTFRWSQGKQTGP